jgi:citronellol/citronellal dehydrogenase
MTTLSGRTMFISGASRGIGLAIAKRAAADGANVALMAKTDKPHPKLEGTVHTAAAEIEGAGGRALPIVGDIRREDEVAAAVARAADRFGGIDLCVNNASAIALMPVADLPVKRYELMQDVNTRGTFVVTQACLPYLRESDHAHVLSLSPPLGADPRWLRGHSAYTLSKYGMTMLTLGVAADEAQHSVAANCLWPRTIIATAAVQNLLGGDQAMARARNPRIMGDAAHAILTRDPAECTGNAFLDDEVLAEAGTTDLTSYAYDDGADLQLDVFVEDWGGFEAGPKPATA